MKKTMIVVVGATATGKTAFAIALARRYATDIISCDSRQCYRELNIGVARPSPDELAAVPHHFIANRSATNAYNVFSYAEEALACANALFASHDTVVVVGGSGLYADALCHGIAHLPDPSPALRAQLSHQLQAEGLRPLQEQLLQLDPTYYHTVDLQNPVRLQRALEVCLTTGRPYSEAIRQQPQPRPFQIVKMGLQCDREELRRRIDNRVEAMMTAGLMDEVRNLLPLRHLQTLHTVGYKELFSCIDGSTTLQQAVAAIKTNTWHYAKKQMSYFARDTSIRWQHS